MTATSPRPRGRILGRTDEVDARLHELDLTRPLLARVAFEGDIDRRSVPPFGYDGHEEYAAGSRMRSTLCERGGETDGGWHKGNHLGIPVAFNHDESIAIHATAGTAGTGQADGEPHNGSLKGPHSRRAASEAHEGRLFSDDDKPVDFWWFFTHRDEDGLWAELYAPVFEAGGIATGWAERVILGNLGPGMEPSLREPQSPQDAPDIEIPRRTA